MGIQTGVRTSQRYYRDYYEVYYNGILMRGFRDISDAYNHLHDIVLNRCAAKEQQLTKSRSIYYEELYQD